MRNLFYIFLIITLFNSCSKDDPIVTPVEQLIDGGIIKKLSLTKIVTDNLNQEEYNGKIGNVSVLLLKTDNNELTFTVPNTIDIGKNILEIPNLNNLKIEYEVIDITLSGTPEKNVSTYFENANKYLATISNSNTYEKLNNYFQNLNNYFKNSSEEEKIIMAKFYKTNQEFFDSILNGDFLNKSTDKEDVKILIRYGTAVLTCGVTTAIAILNQEPVTKAIAAGIAIVAFDVAEDLKRDFANRNIVKLNVIIDGVISELISKSSKQTELIVYNEVESSFAIQSKSRAISLSDNSSNNENVSKFFTNLDTYNSVVSKINDAITFVNDKLFFSNISLLDYSEVNTNSAEVTEDINELFFEKVNFSIESDNISIENISYENDNLKIKVKIVDDSTVNEFVETKLNYTYKDDFNNISGSFPLKVYKNLIFGTWTINISDTCTFTDGTTDSDSYNGQIILNEDYTVTYVGVNNSNNVSNSFTFSNNKLVITTSYNSSLTTSCNGQDSVLITDVQTMEYDVSNNSFSGTTQSSSDEIRGVDNQGNSCIVYGKSCNGTVTLKR